MRAGFGFGNRLVLYKNQGGYQKVDQAPFTWSFGRAYSLWIRAPVRLTAGTGDQSLIDWTDGERSYLHGQIGFSNFAGCTPATKNSMSDNTPSTRTLLQSPADCDHRGFERSLPCGILRSLVEHGFPGDLPGQPNRTVVFGLPAFRDVAHTPILQTGDFGIHRQAVLPALAECSQRGVKAAVIITAGFAEADIEGRRMQQEIAHLAKQAVCGC
jgi:hypothetical protein